ncbi:MAG TPA: DUF882 domain-containing protein [Alphaproteobacteria bacterium]|nr:DUF882 domain-containing protein [Alphaproteobacteria bacterium]
MHLSRRSFLKKTTSAFLATLLPPKLLIAKALPDSKDENLIKKISLYNCHTGQSLKDFVFFEKGEHIKDSLKSLDKFFKDHRTSEVKPLDPTLYDLLWQLASKLETTKSIEIISGYRSASTNKALCEKSKGVAKNSQHVLGKAIDLMIPSHSIKTIVKAAKSLKLGGVGGYKDFVHVDTARIRSWGIA